MHSKRTSIEVLLTNDTNVKSTKPNKNQWQIDQLSITKHFKYFLFGFSYFEPEQNIRVNFSLMKISVYNQLFINHLAHK